MHVYNQRVHRFEHVMRAAIVGEEVKGLVLQVLVDSRAIAMVGDKEQSKKLADRIEQSLATMRQKMAAWSDYSDAKDADRMKRTVAHANDFIKRHTELVRLSREATLPEVALYASADKTEDSRVALDADLQVLTDLGAVHMGHAADLSRKFYSFMLVLMACLVAVGVLLGLFAVFLVISHIARPVARLTERVAENTRRVAMAATQASAAVSQVSDGSNVQLVALRHSAAALAQNTDAIAEVARSTQLASERAKEAAELVDNGIDRMSAMLDVVNAIAENSSRISHIAGAISRIASQTNMLSLNAAIEAARAGEHGRGFAVVAEEVRKLAENSGNLAQEIAGLNQRATEEAQRGVAMAHEVSGNMRQIAEGVQQSDRLVGAIAAAMEEQEATVKGINTNVADLTRIGQSNAAAAEEITATMVDLSKLTERSRVEVDEFRKVGL
jgi:methyl-accepting chemotaxis protein